MLDHEERQTEGLCFLSMETTTQQEFNLSKSKTQLLTTNN